MRCLIDTSIGTSVLGSALDKVMDTVCSNKYNNNSRIASMLLALVCTREKASYTFLWVQAHGTYFQCFFLFLFHRIIIILLHTRVPFIQTIPLDWQHDDGGSGIGDYFFFFSKSKWCMSSHYVPFLNWYRRSTTSREQLWDIGEYLFWSEIDI